MLGPGLVVMVADNDAGTISVFAQAGQNHGMGLLWVLAALCPALYVTRRRLLDSAWSPAPVSSAEVLGIKHLLHRGWRDARTFHASFATIVSLAAGIVLLPRLPLGAVTTLVQAFAGILLPSALVLRLILCNDNHGAPTCRWAPGRH